MASNQFLALNNLALKVESAKNYYKVEIILDVNNEDVVETLMAKRSITDYMNTSFHCFSYLVLHSSFKRPFFVGKNSNLLRRNSGLTIYWGWRGVFFFKNVIVTFFVLKSIYELPLM